MAKTFIRERIASPIYLEDGEAIMNVAGTINGTVSVSNGLVLPTWDYMAMTEAVPGTEVYTFKIGGSSGTTVATVTVLYTDSTKETLSSVTLT